MAAPVAATRFHEEDSVDVVFHGVAYNLCLSTLTDGGGGGAGGAPASEPTLALDLEELASGATWHGEFPAAYIESITAKTGSFKRFDVLVKMLQGALWRQADTVYLDLLTYADLVRGCAGAPRHAPLPPPPSPRTPCLPLTVPRPHPLPPPPPRLGRRRCARASRAPRRPLRCRPLLPPLPAPAATSSSRTWPSLTGCTTRCRW
jgi:hypothetical protein